MPPPALAAAVTAARAAFRVAYVRGQQSASNAGTVRPFSLHEKGMRPLFDSRPGVPARHRDVGAAGHAIEVSPRLAFIIECEARRSGACLPACSRVWPLIRRPALGLVKRAVSSLRLHHVGKCPPRASLWACSPWDRGQACAGASGQEHERRSSLPTRSPLRSPAPRGGSASSMDGSFRCRPAIERSVAFGDFRLYPGVDLVLTKGDAIFRQPDWLWKFPGADQAIELRAAIDDAPRGAQPVHGNEFSGSGHVVFSRFTVVRRTRVSEASRRKRAREESEASGRKAKRAPARFRRSRSGRIKHGCPCGVKRLASTARYFSVQELRWPGACLSKLARLSHFVDVSVQIVDPLNAAAVVLDHHLGDFVGDA